MTINDRRKEVHRIDDRKVVGRFVYTRIITALETDKDSRVLDLRQPRENV